MPEYLTPGVFVEEVSFRSKSIEGVSTTTTGFIGPAAYGPYDLEPDVITSLEMFEQIYGTGQQLYFSNFNGDPMHNYLFHAVRGFFSEGGVRMYIVRIFAPRTDINGNPVIRLDGTVDDGAAYVAFPVTSVPTLPANQLRIRARFPGAAGNMLVRLTLRLGQNVLSGNGADRTVGALAENDVVWIRDLASPFINPPTAGTFYTAHSTYDVVNRVTKWSFEDGTGAAAVELDALDPRLDAIQVVKLIVTIFAPSGSTLVYEAALDPAHTSGGALDSVFDLFTAEPTNIEQARSLPIIFERGAGLVDGVDVLNAILDNAVGNTLRAALIKPKSTDVERSTEVQLIDGNDGQRPGAVHYEGDIDGDDRKTGFYALEDIEDISIVAAPGSTFGYDNAYNADAMTIMNLLMMHARKMQYRIAVLDSGDVQAVSAVRALRAKINSKYAALYYPWIRILDPITRQQIHVPPSGFVAGIYARNDITRGVYKAPANEVVTLSIGFERLLNKGQQDVLNPEGINCFRYFEGRGYLLWGARTATDDPEWKYVNLRRYFAYLERSIDRGTQWAVFEPNGPDLWTNVRRTIEGFLLNEWSNGALLGDTPGKAFFVRCDRSIMTQNDLDNGRLVCLIGVAPIRPAEFVIFRIGQWTGEARR